MKTTLVVRIHRPVLVVAVTAALSAPVTAVAADSGSAVVRALVPASAFVQAGAGDQNTQAYVGGLTWEPSWHYRLGPAELGGYFEAAFGKWSTRQDDVNSSSWISQISLTPVLRLRSNGTMRPWFAEFGVGANYIVPIFDTGHKRFGTEFNFGDHLGIGRDLGPHELAIRVQHFSNAGIRHPNPGENFLQLRYAYYFGR